MNRDAKRKPGFYWVRFEGQVIVAEYTGFDALGCSHYYPHWHIPGSAACFADKEVCELLSSRLQGWQFRKVRTGVRR